MSHTLSRRKRANILTLLKFSNLLLLSTFRMQSKMENFSKAAKEYESGSLSEKIRFLQKYTVFENEIRKHEVTIKGIVKKGQVPYKHQQSNYM